MGVSSVNGSSFLSVVTNQKTVHKSDVNKLARSVEIVLQSSAKVFTELNSQKLSSNHKITSLSDSKTIRQTLSDKLEEVKFWKGQFGLNSNEHAGFKGEKLDALAKRIESDIKSLRRAESSCVEKDSFLAKLLEVKNQGDAEGSKLDIKQNGQIGWVHKQ